MSSVVMGVGASHSTLMNTHWNEVADDPGALAFRASLDEARGYIEAIEPDAIVIFGSNHFRGMFLDLMPAITIGVGECIAAGEAETPLGPLPVDQELARHIAWSVIADGFDPAFSLRLNVDHGITHSLQYLTPGLDVPIVPIIINMFAPPLVALRRCHDLGAAVGRAIAADGAGKRVLAIGSGGLSHQLPWPKWFDTFSDDDRFLVEAWLNGRESWRDYEARRRQIVRGAPAVINADFDHEFLALLEAGNVDEILTMSTADLEEVAGNGAQEIRSWLAMAATVGSFRGRTLSYSAIAPWLTGMAVSVLEPQS
jgi:2,3-dihydroxyphenylpropionate 1,2-dioxygenase